MESAVEMHRIRKRFANTLALDDVSVSIAPGRVHGLLGENGAGKTTLMNILYGLLRPDAGEIILGGRPATIRSPHDALAAGLRHGSPPLLPGCAARRAGQPALVPSRRAPLRHSP